jgi:GNAT superfamily N-acetyltransferase
MDTGRNTLSHPHPRPQELQGSQNLAQFSRLLDTAFDVPSGRRFLDDFPVWANAEPPGNFKRLGFFAPSGRLVGCGAARVAELKISEGLKIPLGILGAIATDSDWRGQGMATGIVRQLLGWLDQQKVEISVLWGSEHHFYSQFGFELTGKQWNIPLAVMKLPRSTGSVALGEGWRPALFQALQRRPSGLCLNSADVGWVQAHKNVRWFWLGSESAPLAYAALGRGIDLPGMVHEWGGEPAALRVLLSEIFRRHPEASLLGAPELMKGFELVSGYVPQTEKQCLARQLQGKRYTDLPSFWLWGLDGA